MSGAKPKILLPVETQVREWDAKLLFAGLAAERGFEVILGCKVRLKAHLHSWPRAYYVAKGVTRDSRRLFRILNLKGHVILAWDEEALVYMRPDFYLRRKVFAPSIAEVDALFAWGDDNAELWRRVPAARERPIHVTGNPRGDLLRPELASYFGPHVRRLEERYGDFILFNSNFGQVNHFIPELTLPWQAGEAKGGAEVPEHLLGTLEDPRMAYYRYRLFECFLAALPRVAAAFPHHTLVIRPHPSEGHDTWKQLAEGFDNVAVVSDGNVHAWLLAAGVMLHNGCTSAVEAALLRCPTVAYRPLVHACYDIPLPNALSRAASSPEALIETLGAVLADGSAPLDADQRALLHRHVAATEGRFAAERIVDEIEKIEGSGTRTARRPSAGDRARGQLHSWVRNAKKKLASYRRAHYEQSSYLRHRFPDLDIATVEGQLARFQTVLGRFSRLRIRQLVANLFAVDAT